MLLVCLCTRTPVEWLLYSIGFLAMARHGRKVTVEAHFRPPSVLLHSASLSKDADAHTHNGLR